VQCAGGRGERRRCRQGQRARTRGDQQGEDDPERTLWVDLPPDQPDNCCDQQHHQQEPLRDAVGQFGKLRFVGLRPLQQTDNGR
jgi:hypothetical protein